MLSDLSEWLGKLGVSEAEVVSMQAAIVHENGIMEKVLGNLARELVPISGAANTVTEQADAVLARIRSSDRQAWFMSKPEPTPEELKQILSCYKSTLPNVRHYFSGVAELGPQHKGGGRHREIDSPEEREKIRETIKRRRGPGVTLEDLYESLGNTHGVSASTIKRIWFEKTDQTRRGS